jgi:hypothetical protein
MISIMEETEAEVLLVKASGVLTAQDYEDILIPQLNQRIEHFGKASILFYFADDFKGWEIGAAWDDAVFGMKHRHDFKKVAVVGDQKWLNWAMKIGYYFIDGQVASFHKSEYQNALSWVKPAE